MKGMLARNIVGVLAGAGLTILLYLPLKNLLLALLIGLPIHWFLMGEAYKVLREKEDQQDEVQPPL
jgi:hypothetical protein